MSPRRRVAPACVSATNSYPSHILPDTRTASASALSVVGRLVRVRAPVDQRQSRWTQSPFSVGSNPTGGTSQILNNAAWSAVAGSGSVLVPLRPTKITNLPPAAQDLPESAGEGELLVEHLLAQFPGVHRHHEGVVFDGGEGGLAGEGGRLWPHDATRGLDHLVPHRQDLGEGSRRAARAYSCPFVVELCHARPP